MQVHQRQKDGEDDLHGEKRFRRARRRREDGRCHDVAQAQTCLVREMKAAKIFGQRGQFGRNGKDMQ